MRGSVAQMITMARRQTWWTSTDNVSDSVCLDYINIAKDIFFSRLSKNNNRYTWQIYTANTVSWQSEYTVPKPSPTDTWLKRILDLYIKYSSTEDYRLLKSFDYDGLLKYPDLYTDQQKPFFSPQDGSVFVHPTPDESVTWWLKLIGYYVPLDMTLSDDAEDIKLWYEYRMIYVQYLKAMIFAEKMLPDKMATELAIFDKMTEDAILELSLTYPDSWYSNDYEEDERPYWTTLYDDFY